MADRYCFIPINNKRFVSEELVEFEYHSGFSVSQKQKSIKSLHEEIKNKYPSSKILEISSKSLDEIGIRLSAFNLMFYNENIDKLVSIECIFQSSKVFENGGPYIDILNKSSIEAKKDNRIKESGELLYFEYNNKKWNLEPKTMFYDYIYIKALTENMELAEKLLEYDCFTDIEFNHNKSINCQARSAALYVSLIKQNKLNNFINDQELFAEIYYTNTYDKQTSLFDL